VTKTLEYDASGFFARCRYCAPIASCCECRLRRAHGARHRPCAAQDFPDVLQQTRHELFESSRKAMCWIFVIRKR